MLGASCPRDVEVEKRTGLIERARRVRLALMEGEFAMLRVNRDAAKSEIDLRSYDPHAALAVVGDQHVRGS